MKISKQGAYDMQFRKTVAKTGRWRGKPADKYVKYKKVKKEPKPTFRFDSFRGYISLDGLGRPQYNLVKIGGVDTLVWAKTRRKKKVTV